MDFKPKTYRISSVWFILLEISHLSFLCQLKVLGHFAKNWFGKKIRLQLNTLFCVKFAFNVWCADLVLLDKNIIHDLALNCRDEL